MYEVDLDEASCHNSLARAIMTTATLDEVEAYSREVCGFSEIDYDRNKAAWLKDQPPVQLDADAMLHRLDQFEAEAQSRGVTHTTFRHLTEVLNLNGSQRDASRRLLISSRPKQYAAPLWRGKPAAQRLVAVPGFHHACVMTDLWNALSAVGTCAATLVAVTIATLDARRTRRNELEQQLIEADRQKEKARTVVAELDDTLSKAYVSNFGASPILNLEVLGMHITVTREDGDQVHHYRPRSEIGQFGWQVVPPGQTVTATIDVEEGLVRATPGPDAYDVMVDIVFTDADGRVWKRTGDQQPERITRPELQIPEASGSVK